jgi:hypothetical protein
MGHQSWKHLRTMRRILSFAAVLLVSVALAAGAVGAGPARALSLPGRVPASEGKLLPASQHRLSPVPADLIGQVATSKPLQAVYGGDVAQPDGTLTVYVTASGLAAMQAALTKVAGPPGTWYVLHVVRHSFADLERLTMTLANKSQAISARADLVMWGPDPSSNKVFIKIARYTRAAAAYLARSYGANWVTVRPYTGPLPVRTANRDYDTEPFYNGDRVWFNNKPNGARCTDGFAYAGKHSGIIYNTTAGHCRGDSVWTNFTAHYKLGNITTNYFSRTSGWDMESFLCASCTDQVWIDPPLGPTGTGHSVTVIGVCTTCGIGEEVTTDGATTGEVRGNYVVDTDICFKFSDGIRTCHLDYAQNSDHSKTICAPGDSGGPVYQYYGDKKKVYAAGVIVGTVHKWDCLYEDMALMLKKVSGKLVTGS